MRSAGLVRWGLLAVWVGLLLTAFVLAPAPDGQDGARVMRFFQLQGEPIAVAIFNGLGLWPLVFAAVLLRDPSARVPTWPFVLLSMAAGAFVLLPGLVLRRWVVPGRSPLGPVRRWLTGRLIGGVVLLGSLALLGLAVLAGCPSAFVELASRSSLVTVMSVDFAVLCLTWFVVLWHDAQRHPGPAWRWLLGAIPLVGPGLWLVLRDSRG